MKTWRLSISAYYTRANAKPCVTFGCVLALPSISAVLRDSLLVLYLYSCSGLTATVINIITSCLIKKRQDKFLSRFDSVDNLFCRYCCATN